jgi:hypothetical protein
MIAAGALALGIVSGCRIPERGGTSYSVLFDGTKGLAGWVCDPVAASGHWKLEGQTLAGENPDRAGSILWTADEYRDFELDLEYRTTSSDYDSGVFVRGPSHQVQIGISRSLQADMTGCIYAPADGQGGYPARTDKVAEFHDVGVWNRLRIVVRGKRIQTFLNGEPFVDYPASTIPAQGPIGLQLHAGVHMHIAFRAIRIRELPSESAPAD